MSHVRLCQLALVRVCATFTRSSFEDLCRPRLSNMCRRPQTRSELEKSLAFAFPKLSLAPNCVPSRSFERARILLAYPRATFSFISESCLDGSPIRTRSSQLVRENSKLKLGGFQTTVQHDVGTISTRSVCLYEHKGINSKVMLFDHGELGHVKPPTSEPQI